MIQHKPLALAANVLLAGALRRSTWGLAQRAKL